MASNEELEAIEEQAKKEVNEGKKYAWNSFVTPMKEEQKELVELLNNVAQTSENKVFIEKISSELNAIKEPIRKEIITTARKVLRMVVNETASKTQLSEWITNYISKIQPKFSSHLFSQSENNILTSIVELVKN